LLYLTKTERIKELKEELSLGSFEIIHLFVGRRLKQFLTSAEKGLPSLKFWVRPAFAKASAGESGD
jgi:hypothetical protein